MSNRCTFCETETATDMLVLGSDWYEFCPPCGDWETLTNAETGEVATIRMVFDGSIGNGTGPVATAEVKEMEPIEGVLFNGEEISVWDADQMYWDEAYHDDGYGSHYDDMLLSASEFGGE